MNEEHPDISESLQSKEVVEWTSRRDTPFKYWSGVMVIFLYLSLIFTTDFGLTPFYLIGGGLIGVIVGYWFLKTVILQPTWYFVTNMRVLETRGSKIVKEIERSYFGDKPLEEFVSVRDLYLSNSVPIYRITIYDPVTSVPLTIFDGVRWGNFQDMLLKDCTSCELSFSARLESCIECGQTLE